MTTLFFPDSVEELPVFTVGFNGVALNRRIVERSIACVLSFVRSPRFTQRDFFSDNGINLLVSAVNAAGSMRDQSTCEPWANVLPEGYEATFGGSKKGIWCCGCQTEEGTGHIREMVRSRQRRVIWSWGGILSDWSADIRCCWGWAGWVPVWVCACSGSAL